MKECKTEYILEKKPHFYSCVYIYIYVFYIYISIYLHCSYNCHLTKEIQWTEQSSRNFTSWSSSGRTGFQLGQQYFILTAFLLTEIKQVRRQSLFTSYIFTSAKLNPFILSDLQVVWSEWWAQNNSDSSIMVFKW